MPQSSPPAIPLAGKQAASHDLVALALLRFGQGAVQYLGASVDLEQLLRVMERAVGSRAPMP